MDGSTELTTASGSARADPDGSGAGGGAAGRAAGGVVAGRGVGAAAGGVELAGAGGTAVDDSARVGGSVGAGVGGAAGAGGPFGGSGVAVGLPLAGGLLSGCAARTGLAAGSPATTTGPVSTIAASAMTPASVRALITLPACWPASGLFQNVQPRRCDGSRPEPTASRARINSPVRMGRPVGVRGDTGALAHGLPSRQQFVPVAQKGETSRRDGSWSRGAWLWRTPATDLSRRIDGRHLLTVLRQPVDERGNPWFGLLHSLGAFALVAALVWITLDAGPRVPAGVPRQA